jgi:hypothetical protein
MALTKSIKKYFLYEELEMGSHVQSISKKPIEAEEVEGEDCEDCMKKSLSAVKR